MQLGSWNERQIRIHNIVLSISFQLNFKDVHFGSAESPWFIHIIDIIMCTVPTHDHVHMNNMPITPARLLRI